MWSVWAGFCSGLRTCIRASGFFRRFSGHFQWRLIPQVVSGYGAVMALMAAGYLLHMLPRRAEAWGERTVAGAPLVVKALMLTVLIWCVMQIKSSEIQPFIYFQF